MTLSASTSNAADTPSAALLGCAADHGLIVAPGGPLGGWVLYDETNGFPVSDRMGYPLHLLDPTADVPDKLKGLFWSWEWARERLDWFTKIAAGDTTLIEPRFRCGADWVRAIHACPDRHQLTHEVVRHLVARTETPMMPEVLWAAHHAGASRSTIGKLVGWVWAGSEYPDACLARKRWRTLFKTAGFRIDGKNATPPGEPVRLYRGSVPKRRGDWSWTDNREVAHQFAHAGKGMRPPGAVWTALVPPEHIYGCNTTRDEAEWVAEVPRHLIEPDPEPCTCPS